jgi:hypothetical protein
MSTSAELVCHPGGDAGAVRRIRVRASRDAELVRFEYVLEADLSRLRIPPPGPLRPGHELWRHTCCEAFVGLDRASAYHELNFAPSSEWAAYAFDRYREGKPLDDESIAPRIVVRTTRERLGLDAELPLARLSPAYGRTALRLALSVVVEDADGALSYWALRHPPGKPDFHHADAFALRLEPPTGAC